jgi:hypothetical protein
MAITASAAPMKAPDLGALRNSLHFLSDDGRRLRPRAFLEATGLGAAELATCLGRQRTHMYREEIPLPTTKLKKYIIDLVLVTDLAFELFQGNRDETRRWMMLPNTILFGKSPFEACFAGQGEGLIEWLNTRLNRIPGSAF